MAKDATVNIKVVTDRPFFFEMSQAEQEKFDDALSDVICWLGGFQAAGGTYTPGSIEALRELRLKLQPK